MKSHALAVIAVAIASSATLSATAQDSANAIFREAPANLNLTEQQRSLLDLAAASGAATGVELVEADSMFQFALTRDAGNPAVISKLSLMLSANTVLKASRASVVDNADMGMWRGTVDGSEGRVTIMWWGDGQIAGTVQHEGRYYSIRRIDGRLHAIVELSDDRLPPEHPSQLLVSGNDRFGQPHGTNVSTAPQRQDRQTKRRKSEATDDIIIDVLVAYTKKAASDRDIKRELVDLAIEEANESLPHLQARQC